LFGGLENCSLRVADSNEHIAEFPLRHTNLGYWGCYSPDGGFPIMEIGLPYEFVIETNKDRRGLVVSAVIRTGSIKSGQEVYYGKVNFYNEGVRKNTFNSSFNIMKIESLPKVSIVYGHIGGALDMVKAAIESGAKGIVYAGVGDGNIYSGDLKELEKARKDGIAVVISSRTGSGVVVHDDELDDTKYQFVTSDNLNPEKARILLQVALTKNNDYKEIQSCFNKY